MRPFPSARLQADSLRRFLHERTSNGTNSSQSYLWHAPRLDPAGNRVVRVCQNDFVSAHETLKLFGDYALIINEALNGDQKLKAKVAQADRFNRGGLAVLQNALKNRSVTLTGKLADILASCVADQEFWEAKQKDFDRIHQRPNGRWQVQITIDEVRYSKTFDDLADAQRYRDRMILLGLTIEAENRELMPPDK